MTEGPALLTQTIRQASIVTLPVIPFYLLLPAITAIYFGAAKLGFTMAVGTPQVTAVWPPTGIALTAVVLFGYRVWPAVWIAAFLANATADGPLAAAAGIATGNALEAVAGAWLLRRSGFHHSLERLRHVLSLVGLAAVLSTIISATIGMISLCLGGVYPWSAFHRIWFVWWLGDAMGALVVAPLLLVWSRCPPHSWPRNRAWTGLALLGGLTVASWLVFGMWVAPAQAPLQYVVFPFVIVAALRFGQLGTTTVTAVASAIAIWGTVAGTGPFGGQDIGQGLVLVQLFLAIVAGSGLILAAAINERAAGDRLRVADYAATQALADSRSLEQAAPRVLRAVCESLDWDLGALWLVVREAQVLRCLDLWHVPSRSFAAFEAISRGRTFAPGIGLPGRVWASGEPAWIPDVVVDRNFPRAPVAASEGLHGAFAFPIRVGSEILGVIEFFNRELQQPDDGLLARMAALGSQIGQFIERQRAEGAVRASEARKTAILEAALDCIITMDHEGRITEFNPAAERTFGYCRAETIGRPLADLIIPPELREGHRRGLAEYLQSGEGPVIGKRIELVAMRADGTVFPVELAISQIAVDGLRIFTGYVRDISERKRAESEREELLARERAARSDAEQANRAKDEFLAMLGHELRNPLGAIASAVSVLNLVDRGHQSAKPREIIARQVGHLARLVDDLLDVARVTSGRVELQRQAVDLGKLAEHCVVVLQSPQRASDHQVLVSTMSVVVDADPARLEQVITNLLDNAAKYTPSGGHIWVSVTREPDRAVLRVKDDGIGIPADILPRVFDLFVQADRSLDRSRGGLGLGLTLVKRLVTLHGGRVSAHSGGREKGSEFVVELPLAHASADQAAARDLPVEQRRPRRVLVIEDHEDARESLRLLLTAEGHTVAVAAEGAEGLGKLRSWRPDVALVDIGLPGLDGYALAHAVRSDPDLGDILLVALTGYGQPEDRQRATGAGFKAHLVKPVSREALMRVISAPPVGQ